jgi:RHS repeat-associated protein
MDNNDGVITKYQNGLGIDNKLKLTTNGTSKYFLQDHLGSTTGLANSSGSLVDSTTYDAFGNASSNLSTRYSYTGREYDSFTGLYYYRARFYDAKLGRFISEDPIGFAGGDVNLFGYVWNNPQGFTDPSGLFPTGSEIADYLDEKIAVAQDFYGFDPIIGYSTIPGQMPQSIKMFDLSRGTVDMLRVGDGLGHALYCDDNIYGQAAYVTMDIGRGAGLFSLLGGVAAKVVGPPNKGLGTNPFKGKTPNQIEDMFNKKGFQPSGPDPLNGYGGYVNPKSGRSYHIDPTSYGKYPEPNHVDVNRLRSYKGDLKKRKYPY